MRPKQRSYVGDTLHAALPLRTGTSCPQLGSVRISEIESVRGRLGLPVERDRHFSTTRTISALAAEARAAGCITA